MNIKNNLNIKNKQEAFEILEINDVEVINSDLTDIKTLDLINRRAIELLYKYQNNEEVFEKIKESNLYLINLYVKKFNQEEKELYLRNTLYRDNIVSSNVDYLSSERNRLITKLNIFVEDQNKRHKTALSSLIINLILMIIINKKINKFKFLTFLKFFFYLIIFFIFQYNYLGLLIPSFIEFVLFLIYFMKSKFKNFNY